MIKFAIIYSVDVFSVCLIVRVISGTYLEDCRNCVHASFLL